MNLKQLSHINLALVLSGVLMACPSGEDPDMGMTVDTGAETDAGEQTDTGTIDMGPGADMGPDIDMGVPDTGEQNPDMGVACDMDMIAPTVTATPASPINLPFDATTFAVRFDFSEAVLTDNGGFSVDNGATIDAVNDLGNNSYEVQLSGLASGITYSLLAETSITDVCANPLDAPLTVTINVGVDPCVGDMTGPMVTLPASPIGVATGTSSVTVTASFDEPIAPLDPGDVTVNNGATIASVTATTGNDYNILVTGLQGGVTTLSVEVTVEDACGNAMASPASVDIVTDAAPPMVSNISPFDGAVNQVNTATITVTFNEAIDIASGSIDVTANGTAIATTIAWSAGDTVLGITPSATLPDGAVVVTTLTGIQDLAGNTMPTFTSSFAVLDPCAGQPATANIDATPQSPIAQNGAINVGISIDAPFDLVESDVTVIPGTGAGTLLAGSFGGSGTLYSFVIDGVNTGDTYTVSVRGLNSPNGCTTLPSVTIPVSVSAGGPTASGTCPLPATFANHFTAVDVCDEGTNSTFATSQPTGFTVSNPGDGLSISGIYDADSIGGGDFDYFSFTVNEDGTSLTDVQVSISYGCNFQGTGTRSNTDAPEIALYDNNNSQLANFDANDVYGAVDGSGNYGFGIGNFELAGAAGANTYHVRVDDNVGSNWCMDYVIHVQMVDNTRDVACQGLPPVVAAVGGNQNSYINGSAGGLAVVRFDTSAAFPVMENQITVTPANGGAGILAPGTLSNAGNVNWGFGLAGAADGDIYDISIASTSSTCSTLTSTTFQVSTTTDLNGIGACPLPPAAPLAYNAIVECGNANNNGTVATSEPTGLTLATVGDQMSITGIYDSTPATDFDYYSFSITETGTEITDLRFRVAYGCSFTGTGVPGGDSPEVGLYDAAGARIDFFRANDDYNTINGTGLFGFGEQQMSVAGPAGTNLYHIRLDDVVGSNWCMDYVVYVDLVDNTRPAACLNAPATSDLTNTTVQGLFDPQTGLTTIPIDLSDNYQGLAETDLTLNAVTGVGTILAGSFAGADSAYTVDLTGTAVGDSYTLTVAGGTDQCGTVFSGGQITVDVVDAACAGVTPGPTNVTTAFFEAIPDLNGGATVDLSFSAPFQLQETDLTLTLATGQGNGTIVPGSLTGGPTDWSFMLSGLTQGDTYDLAVGARTDRCGVVVSATNIPIDIVGPRTCPVPPPLTNHFANPDVCDAGTNSTLATASQTGFILAAAGDEFSVGGIYDSDSIGGSDNDYYAFTITGDGVNTYDLDVRIGYGCNFQGTGIPGAFAPLVEIRNDVGGSGTQVGADVDGGDNYSVINGSGDYGYGRGQVSIPPASNPAGNNTFHVYLDDVVGSNWCMDYTIYVRLARIRP